MFPRNRLTTAGQFDKLVDLGVLDGFEPVTPFISKSSKIVTMGSCFAENVAENLTAAGYDVFQMTVLDRIFTHMRSNFSPRMSCATGAAWTKRVKAGY